MEFINMASCEKCWKDSGGDPNKYTELVNSRNCTSEEQAGEVAETCPNCFKDTIHIYCKVCMECGFKYNRDVLKEKVKIEDEKRN